MIRGIAQGLLHCDSDKELTVQECLLAKGILIVVTNSRYYIIVKNILRRPQKFNRHKVLRRFTNDTYKIVNTDS